MDVKSTTLKCVRYEFRVNSSPVSTNTNLPHIFIYLICLTIQIEYYNDYNAREKKIKIIANIGDAVNPLLG